MDPTRGKAATSSLTDPTKDTTPDKKTSVVTISMKREKPTGLRSNDKNVKPSKKLKVRITSDDQSPSEAGQSKEANNTPVYPSGRVTRVKAGGETSETTKSISNGKKTPGKREKAAELKSPVIKSARKKGEMSADNKGQKTLPKGAKGDSTKITTRDIAEEAVTLLMHLSGENDPLNPEAETPQSFAPLSPETTGNQEDTEANADTTVRRKTGRPHKVKRQAKLPETPLRDLDMDAQMNVDTPNVLTIADIFPNGYPMKIVKNNLRVDFETLTCSESSCLIAVDILKNHSYQNMLTNSATVPEIYIQQFWTTMQKIKGQNAVTVTLNHKQLTITPADLRAVLLIPDIIPIEYSAAPTKETVMQFLIDIGYDEASGVITKHSHVDLKNIPQPWRTLYIIITKSVSGRDSGYEHPKLMELQIFWALINLKHIEVEALIWDDMMTFLKKLGSKIPYIRYTKLLIQRALGYNPDIPKRINDPDNFDILSEPTLTVRFKESTTKKQGAVLQDHLLSDELKQLYSYKRYLVAVRENKVGILDDKTSGTPTRKTRRGSAASTESQRKFPKRKPGSKRRVPSKEAIPIPKSEPQRKLTDEDSEGTASDEEIFYSETAKDDTTTVPKPPSPPAEHGKGKTPVIEPEDESPDEEQLDTTYRKKFKFVRLQHVAKEFAKDQMGGPGGSSGAVQPTPNHRTDDDDDDRSYRLVHRNEKKQTPNPTPRRSTTTTLPTPSTEPLIAPIPTPEPTTQELDELSFVTVAQMKTVMSTAIAHVNEQIEKAVVDQFKKYLASQPTTSQQTTSSTPHHYTSGPQHNYKDFEFEELKQMMLAHMLDQPELRNAKPALFGYLYRGADLECRCTTNVRLKRPLGDPDSVNHEGEKTKIQKTSGETTYS